MPRFRVIAAAASSGDLVHEFKYGRQLHLRHPLADWLGETLDDPRLRDRRFDVIVPVPLHPARERERGFNQAAAARGTPDAQDGHSRCSMRSSASATRPRRPHSIAPSAWKICVMPFVYGQSANVRDLRVLLIDDVLTTGSTLSECARVLRKAGALSVHAATAARA